MFRVKVADFGYSEDDKISFINDMLLGYIGKNELTNRIAALQLAESSRGDYKLRRAGQQFDNVLVQKSNGPPNCNFHGVFIGTVEKQNDQKSDVFMMPIASTDQGGSLTQKSYVAPSQVVNALFEKLQAQQNLASNSEYSFIHNGTSSAQNVEKQRKRETQTIEAGLVRRLRQNFMKSDEMPLDHSSTARNFIKYNNASQYSSDAYSCRAKSTSNLSTNRISQSSTSRTGTRFGTRCGQLHYSGKHNDESKQSNCMSSFQEVENNKSKIILPPGVAHQQSEKYEQSTHSPLPAAGLFFSKDTFSSEEDFCDSYWNKEDINGKSRIVLGKRHTLSSPHWYHPECEESWPISQEARYLCIGSRRRQKRNNHRCKIRDRDCVQEKDDDLLDSDEDFFEDVVRMPSRQSHLQIGRCRKIPTASNGNYPDQRRNVFRMMMKASPPDSCKFLSPGPRCVERLDYPFSDSSSFTEQSRGRLSVSQPNFTTSDSRELSDRPHLSRPIRSNKNHPQRKPLKKINDIKPSFADEDLLELSFNDLKEENRNWKKFQNHLPYEESDERYVDWHLDKRRQAYEDRVKEIQPHPPSIIDIKASSTTFKDEVESSTNYPSSSSQRQHRRYRKRSDVPIFAKTCRNISKPIDIEYDERTRQLHHHNEDSTSDEERAPTPRGRRSYLSIPSSRASHTDSSEAKPSRQAVRNAKECPQQLRRREWNMKDFAAMGDGLSPRKEIRANQRGDRSITKSRAR